MTAVERTVCLPAVVTAMGLCDTALGASRAAQVKIQKKGKNVPPTFLAASRYRTSSICFVQIDSLLVPFATKRRKSGSSLLVHFLFSGALDLLQLLACNIKKGHESKKSS